MRRVAPPRTPSQRAWQVGETGLTEREQARRLGLFEAAVGPDPGVARRAQRRLHVLWGCTVLCFRGGWPPGGEGRRAARGL